MDKDGNGKLDAQEFRDAMDKLSNDHLPGGTVGTIFSAMNLHGAITLEDFLQIVEVGPWPLEVPSADKQRPPLACWSPLEEASTPSHVCSRRTTHGFP